ncbi:MAG TPA: Uma2 family endonuclease [Tepidisphaeraceae bacterium]|nr:Uma2 family endonuclease [Tepidisphaeraceae bacterium]
MGEDPPGVRLELVDGEIAVSPSPIPDHGFVISALLRILGNHVEEYDLGQLFPDVDTIFGEFDVRRPDILFFSKSRLHLIGDKAMEGPPDLCIEVISPSSGKIDREDKLEQYQQGGVANYWIVDPVPRILEAYQLKKKAYTLVGKGQGSAKLKLPPFPDLEIPLQKLWRLKK